LNPAFNGNGIQNDKEFTMKLYKVMSEDFQSCNGGSFDWKKYLPKNGKSGKWTPAIKNAKICSNGYHLTKHWNMWINHDKHKIYECEAKGIIEWNYDKCVCKQVRLIKEFIPEFKNDLNTGKCNTGDSNTGDSNTGYRNTGNRNTGYRNTGNRNTGDRNTGNSNTGNSNTGDSNTGYSNTGDRNTGYRNTGDRNTGYWNTGDRNTGCLNTKEPEYYELFNKQIKKEDYKNINFPSYFYFYLNPDKSYKENWLESFNQADKEQIKDTIDLPNFDYKVFEEITGITKAMIKKKIA
jgi:hypothetical protein